MITYNGKKVLKILFGGKEVKRVYFRGILVFQKDFAAASLNEEQEQKEVQPKEEAEK